MHAYKLTGEAKIAGSIEFIQTLVENGQKILVFAHHINVLDAIQISLDKQRGICPGYIRIDGSTDSDKRH